MQFLRAIAAALLLVSPAHATLGFVTGFEGGAWTPADTAGQFVFSSVSSYTAGVCSTGTCSTGAVGYACTTNADCYDIQVASTPAPRSDYCGHDSGDLRGATCATNGDCGSGTCLDQPGNDFVLRVVDSSNSTTTTVAEFQNSSLATTCFLQAVRVDDATYRLQVFHGQADDQCSGGINDGTVCTACTTNGDCGTACVGGDEPGTSCSVNGDCAGAGTCTTGQCVNTGSGDGACSDVCQAETLGEQWCLPSTLASTGDLTVGRWYEFVIGDRVSASSIKTCVIYEGGFERGRRSTPYGDCSDNSWACDSNVDCNSGATCDAIGAAGLGPTRVIVGTSGRNATIGAPLFLSQGSAQGVYLHALLRVDQVGSSTQPYKLALDDLGHQNRPVSVDTTMAVMRVADAHPDSTIADRFSDTPSASNHANVDDSASGAPDDDSTYVSKRVGSGTDTDIYTLSDLTLASGESVPTTDMGVAVSMRANESTDSASGSGKYVWIELSDSSSANDIGIPCSTNSDCSDAVCVSSVCQTDLSDAASTGYAWQGYGIITQKPGGGSWDETALDGMRMELNYNTSASSWRVTDALVEYPIAIAAPSAPGVFPDVNNDGEKRLCIATDSTGNNADFHTAIVSSLEDLDSFVACSKGSTTILDIANDATDIMDGLAGGFMNCRYYRGDQGPCDVLMVISGVNTITGNSPVPGSFCVGGTEQGTSCTQNADCAGSGECQYYATGYCRGGTDHGAPCSCPRNSAVTLENATYYCANNAVDWLGTGYSQVECGACATNSDCDSDIPCATNADCGSGLNGAATCDGGTCYARCTAGQCDRNGSTILADASSVVPNIWAMPGCAGAPGCSDGLCIGANTEAEYERGLRKILQTADARTNTGAACTNNGDCAVDIVLAPQPHAVEKSTFFWGSFYVHRKRGNSIASMQRHIADAEARHLVDLAAKFRRDCGTDEATCHNDAIHWSDTGYSLAEELIEQCFENQSGTGDGVCSAGACTAGLVSNVCATNADCDLYRCSF